MRDPTRYEELAAYARDNGYPDVTGPGLHKWVKRGLLPLAEPRHYGQARRTFTYPVRTGAQLLALCRLRFRERVRDLDAIAGSLWLDGYDIAPDVVARALAKAADFGRAERAGATLAARRGEREISRRDAIDTFAEAATSTPGAAALSPVARADATIAIADLVASAVGVADGPPELGGMAAVLDLTPEGVDQLAGLVPSFEPTHIAGQIARASPEELGGVREAACRGAEAVDPSTLPPLARLHPRQMAMLLAAALLVHRDSQAFADVLAAASAEPLESGAMGLRYLP